MKQNLLLEKKKLGLEEVISDDEFKKMELGWPIQKIIGFIDFDDLKINVNRKVFIPRYETYEVILKSLEYIKPYHDVLDLCSGSGIIGLTIKQKTNANVTLADIDNESIEQSKENALENNLDVTIIQSDLFENIEKKYDVIICNPPYIPLNEKLDDSVINFEPFKALFAGQDGNYYYKKILESVNNFLKKNGIIVFEISDQNSKYLSENYFDIYKDINGKKRIAVKLFNS